MPGNPLGHDLLQVLSPLCTSAFKLVRLVAGVEFLSAEWYQILWSTFDDHSHHLVLSW